MKFAGQDLIYLSKKVINEINRLKSNEKSEKESETPENKMINDSKSNIFTIQYDKILESIPICSDKIIKCENCNSILNKYSKINKIKENNYEWICEFCNFKNEIHNTQIKIPESSMIEYNIITPELKFIQLTNEKESSNIIFCLDISGSMFENYKGGKSRFEFMKSFMKNNLDQINKNNPNCKVGIVTFGEKVEFYGDGDYYYKLNDEEINNEEKVIELGKSLLNPIKLNINKLQNIITKLFTFGKTCLGPSVLISLSSLIKTNTGGRIFILTDGLANIGLGSLKNENEISINFYKKLGEMAKNNGICINLITFAESESRIELLYEMIQKSKGEIFQINDFNFSNSLLNNDILTVKTTLKINLHKVLEFKNQNNKYLKNDGSCYNEFIGNTKKDMNPFFEFDFKSPKKILLMNDIDINKLKQLPFQTSIEYFNLKGEKRIRVYNELKNICYVKEEIEKKSDYEIISVFAIQGTSKLLLERKIPELEEKTKEWELFFNSNKNVNSSSKSNYDIVTNKINEIRKNTEEISESNIINDRIFSLNYRLNSISILNDEKERENLINKHYTSVDTKIIESKEKNKELLKLKEEIEKLKKMNYDLEDKNNKIENEKNILQDNLEKQNKEMDRKNKENKELNKNLIGVIQKKKKLENQLEEKEKIINQLENDKNK